MLAEYEDIDPSDICPTKTLDGVTYPDMRNHMPSRVVTIEEARARGWSLFYDGRVCPSGHRAPRYVSNSSRCVDCVRVGRKQPTIGTTGRYQPQPKAVLEETEADEAATWVEPFEWTEVTHAAFISAFINTGEKKTACDTLGIAAGVFWDECDDNPAFAERVRKAEAVAAWALIERAKMLASRNDALLMKLDPFDRRLARQATHELRSCLKHSKLDEATKQPTREGMECRGYEDIDEDDRFLRGVTPLQLHYSEVGDHMSRASELVEFLGCWNDDDESELPRPAEPAPA